MRLTRLVMNSARERWRWEIVEPFSLCLLFAVVVCFLCVICLHKSDYKEKIFYGKELEGIQQQQKYLLPNVKEFNSLWFWISRRGFQIPDTGPGSWKAD